MAGSGDVLGIAATGLLAFQRSLATTSHNISNASTEGYSRQRVGLSPQVPTPTGAGFIGSGVKVDTVVRSYDSFLNLQVRAATSNSARLQAYHEAASRISNLLGDENVGLSASLDRFFNAVQGVANDPASIPARQVLLSEAETFTNQIHYLDDQLRSTRANLNTQITSLTGEINALTAGIAELNESIRIATGRAGGQPPNDLLDQRDLLLEKLAQYVTVSSSLQDDGTVNVFVGNGQALVTGTGAATLSVAPSQFDPGQLDILYNTKTSSVIITNNLSGGKLGGLLDFRREILDPAQNALGRIAMAVSTEFNAQHALGMDLDGDSNNPFFKDVTTNTSISASVNGGDYLLSSTVTDVSKLGLSDYRLDYDGANFTLRRLSDNQTVGTYAGFPIDVTTSEGFTINFASGTTVVAGDSFLVQPTRKAARDVGLLVSNVRDIAAANPVRIGEATNANGVPTNSGAAVFGNVVLGNTGSLPFGAGVTFTYDATAKVFNYAGDAAGSFAYDPVTDAGSAFTVAGVTFSVTGVPADGDQFVMGNNTNGNGDNRNALALAGLKNLLALENGNTSFHGAYAQMVADAGTRTRQAEISRNAQEGLLQHARNDRDSVSGVNLDEEAANLLRFQQAYQALAQVVATADTLFQTLLGATRR